MSLFRSGIKIAYGTFKLLPTSVRQQIVSPLIKWTRLHGDYHLISYPKCGRTWLRMLVGYCLVHQFDLPIRRYLELDLLGYLDSRVPFIGVSHDHLPQFKTPGELERDKREYSDQKVIFLVRDPRDVIVSNYFQQTKRRETFEGDLEEFVRSDRGGIDTLLDFYRNWFSARETPEDFLLVRYEDLKENVHDELSRVLKFLELSQVRSAIRDEAVEEASFERMKQREKNTGNDNFRLQPGDPSDPESYKVRKGEVGGYVEYLDEETIWFIESRMSSKLPSYYGYEPSLSTSDHGTGESEA